MTKISRSRAGRRFINTTTIRGSKDPEIAELDEIASRKSNAKIIIRKRKGI